jgi:RNA-directed DNA polymerase
MRSSRYDISHIFPSAENSANNSFNYNGNNGNLNNNNRNNTFSVRPLLELENLGYDYFESLPVPLSKFYDIYRITRRHKASKPSHLFFRQDYPRKLRELCYEINNCTYQASDSIKFVVLKPKVRQVIAADFRDRIAQTYFVQTLLPLLEDYEHPESYSCRVGKGSLAAAQRIYDLCFEVSNGCTEDAWVLQIDFQNFFMSLDMTLWAEELKQFIRERYEGEDKTLLLFLADRIYYTCPQEHCIAKGGKWIHRLVPKGKSLDDCEPYHGVPIGNVSSQVMANFVTAKFLRYLESLDLGRFVLYTDDTTIIGKDKRKMLCALPAIRRFAEEEMHLTLHPCKVSLQSVAKGFNALGYRYKWNNMTPSKRVVHNLLRRRDMLLNMESRDIRECYTYKEQAVSHLNAYLGLLKHSRSYNLRTRVIDEILATRWGQLLFVRPDYLSVVIRPEKTRLAYTIRKNRQRRKLIYKDFKIWI